MSFTVSCGVFQKTETVYRTKTEYRHPPAEYDNLYPEPELGGGKNRDLRRLVVDQKEVIRLYRDDVEARIEWREEMEAE